MSGSATDYLKAIKQTKVRIENIQRETMEGMNRAIDKYREQTSKKIVVDNDALFEQLSDKERKLYDKFRAHVFKMIDEIAVDDNQMVIEGDEDGAYIYSPVVGNPNKLSNAEFIKHLITGFGVASELSEDAEKLVTRHLVEHGLPEDYREIEKMIEQEGEKGQLRDDLDTVYSDLNYVYFKVADVDAFIKKIQDEANNLNSILITVIVTLKKTEDMESIWNDFYREYQEKQRDNRD